MHSSDQQSCNGQQDTSSTSNGQQGSTTVPSFPVSHEMSNMGAAVATTSFFSPPPIAACCADPLTSVSLPSELHPHLVTGTATAHVSMPSSAAVNQQEQQPALNYAYPASGMSGGLPCSAIQAAHHQQPMHQQPPQNGQPGSRSVAVSATLSRMTGQLAYQHQMQELAQLHEMLGQLRSQLKEAKSEAQGSAQQLSQERQVGPRYSEKFYMGSKHQ